MCAVRHAPEESESDCSVVLVRSTPASTEALASAMASFCPTSAVHVSEVVSERRLKASISK